MAPQLIERLLTGVSFTRQRFKAFLLILCCIFAIVALIRPKWGYRWEEVKRRGVDIMIALDVSKSMLAEDVSPNRIERAKREIIDLLKILEGDRVGLVAFAGTSFLQTPLTLDYGAVQIFLDDLDTDLIPVPGTAIGAAIDTAVKSFNNDDKKSRVLILITDGEDHQGSPVEAAKLAGKQQIKIYAIGIGKEGGAPIPDRQNGGFKKDRSGELILTKLDEESLQKIALNTGGSYVRSVSGDLDLEKIYDDIRKNVEDKELKSGRRKRYEERYQWPLIIAILLLILEFIYSERRKIKVSKNAQKLIVIIISGMTIVTPTYAELTSSSSKQAEQFYAEKKYPEALKEFVDAQIDDPDSAGLKYNLANTYYQMKDYEKANKLLQSTALYGDNQLSQKSYYNLGNVAYRSGKLQEAVEFYKKALELDPNDQDAKFNLEFVRREIKKRIEENKKRQQQQKQNQQQEQQKKEQKEQQGNDSKQKQKQKQDQKKKKDQGDKKEQKKEQDEPKNKDQKKQHKKDNKQKQKNQQAGKNKKKKMSEEEAKRWLESLSEDRKKHLKKKMEGQGRYRVEKDW